METLMISHSHKMIQISQTTSILYEL